MDALRAMCDKNGWKFKNPGGDEPKIERSNDMNDFYASAKVTVGKRSCAQSFPQERDVAAQAKDSLQTSEIRMLRVIHACQTIDRFKRRQSRTQDKGSFG